MTYTKQTFETWLQNRFSSIHPAVLDDDISDRFNDWLEQLDTKEVIDYAEQYGKVQYLAGMDRSIEILKK